MGSLQGHSYRHRSSLSLLVVLAEPQHQYMELNQLAECRSNSLSLSPFLILHPHLINILHMVPHIHTLQLTVIHYTQRKSVTFPSSIFCESLELAHNATSSHHTRMWLHWSVPGCHQWKCQGIIERSSCRSKQQLQSQWHNMKVDR